MTNLEELRKDVEATLKQAGIKDGLVIHARSGRYMPDEITRIAQAYADAQVEAALKDLEGVAHRVIPEPSKSTILGNINRLKSALKEKGTDE